MDCGNHCGCSSLYLHHSLTNCLLSCCFRSFQELARLVMHLFAFTVLYKKISLFPKSSKPRPLYCLQNLQKYFQRYNLTVVLQACSCLMKGTLLSIIKHFNWPWSKPYRQKIELMLSLSCYARSFCFKIVFLRWLFLFVFNWLQRVSVFENVWEPATSCSTLDLECQLNGCVLFYCMPLKGNTNNHDGSSNNKGNLFNTRDHSPTLPPP